MEPDARVPSSKMGEPQGSLIYLMRYLEGHLSATESDAARRRLDTPQWQAAWEHLQLAAIETTLPVTSWEEPHVPAETLAAFLEGTLSLNEAARVEQHCWDSPELLREFVSTYRFLHVDAPHEEIAAGPLRSSSDRLMALFPAASGDRIGRTNWTPSTADVETAFDRSRTGQRESTVTNESQATLPVVVTSAKRSARARRRTPAWLVYVATVVIGLGLGLTAVVLISRSRDNGAPPHQEIVTPSSGEDPALPRNAPQETELEPALPVEDQRRPDSPSPSRPQPQLPGRPFDVVETPLPPDASTPVPRPPRRPAPTAVANQPPDAYSDLAVEWEKIDGLLIARSDDQQPWHGPYADVHRNTAANYATLPDSWASAKTNHGRIVLADDTLVHLDGTRDKLHLNVERGRAAVSELPADQNVHLSVGPRSWIIQPMESDTAIGCTVFARQSQLVVRRGRISIGGTEIVAGRQVALDDVGLEASPIAASTSWFTRPDKSVKAPAATRDALLASRDVHADLAAIWRADDHPARLFAARWALAIDGDQTLAQALSSRDAELRMVALNWLLACPPDDPRVLQALRELARQTADAQMVRNVMSWLRSAQTKSRVTRADADRMVTGLRSDHLAIRQISAFFLETAFGNRVAFNPVSGPAARQQAAREWTALLDRVDRAGGIP